MQGLQTHALISPSVGLSSIGTIYQQRQVHVHVCCKNTWLLGRHVQLHYAAPTCNLVGYLIAVP